MIEILTDRHTGIEYKTDPHQLEGYDHLAANPRAGLWYGMSLSKTIITLSYLYEMHYRECAILKTLVIAPDKVARITWPDEVDKWLHLDGTRISVIAGTAKQRKAALEADAEIYLLGVDNTAWLVDQFIQKKGSKYVGAIPFDCVVIDEQSLFKNPKAIRFKKLRRAIQPVKYRVGLTGTPGEGVDLWAQMALLDDGERLGETFGRFIEKYFTPRGNGMIIYEYLPRPGAQAIIAQKIADIILSKQTRNTIQLPELHTVDINLEFNVYDKEVYDTLEREYVLDFFDSGEAVTVKSSADLTNKLLQITSGAIYEEQRYDDTGKRLPREWYELNTVKIDALRNLLEEHPEENFIVVYQFRHEIDRIREAFPFARELGKGKQTVEDFKDWNAGRIRLLLIHPAGAGHGLNLQYGGRRMVWFTTTWGLEHYLQTVARLLRRGALKEIFVYRFNIKGTRDPKVCARINSRDSNQTFLLNEIEDLRKKYRPGV